MSKNPGKQAPSNDSLKHEICAFHKDNMLSTQVEIAAHFNAKYNLNIDQATVSKIINEEEKRRLCIEGTSESVFNDLLLLENYNHWVKD